MKAGRVLKIFNRGFEETLTAAETRDYCTYIRKAIYLCMWYEQKYGKHAERVIKEMVDEAKEIEVGNG